jgi:voltage-gated potassium channel Kch
MRPAPVLVIGDGDLATELAHQVSRPGSPCVHLRKPPDRELTRALRAAPRFVAIISHDDIEALRLALVTEHARPGIPLLVTIFDTTVATQLIRAVPNCQVVSLADVAAPVLTDDCVGPAGPVPPSRRFWAAVASQLRPFDASSRLLVFGVMGLLAVLVAEILVAMLSFDHPLATAFYEAAKAVGTVGPDRAAETGPDWYKTFTAWAILISTALTAAATAGLVNRLLSRRLVTMVGRRTLPRADHVIVVGLGQVGLRLCLLLRHEGVRSIAIERDGDAQNVDRAKRLGIPVIIGDGSERGLLVRVGARRARALASVTSDDRVNIAVSVAALAIDGDLRVVLRAGDDDAATETRALFPIGVVRDVNHLAATRFAEMALEAVDEAAERRAGSE